MLSRSCACIFTTASESDARRPYMHDPNDIYHTSRSRACIFTTVSESDACRLYVHISSDICHLHEHDQEPESASFLTWSVTEWIHIYYVHLGISRYIHTSVYVHTHVKKACVYVWKRILNSHRRANIHTHKRTSVHMRRSLRHITMRTFVQGTQS